VKSAGQIVARMARAWTRPVYAHFGPRKPGYAIAGIEIHNWERKRHNLD
jgi:hypothetical protein